MELKCKCYIVFIILLFDIFAGLNVYAARLYPEREYQNTWCVYNGGKTEVLLEDKTRVDCVLPNYAIEFDFANKWSEAVGQSLYYGQMLNKKAAIVLIMENNESDTKYLARLNKIAPLHGITVWTMSPQMLVALKQLENKNYEVCSSTP